MQENVKESPLTKHNTEPSAMDELEHLVQLYPYYHAARIKLLRWLYDQHNPSYNQQLRTAALYLPSREAIFQIVENTQFKPKPDNEPMLSGATVAHKVVSRLDTPKGDDSQRTDSLIGSFLSTLPPDESAQPGHKRPMRPIDATQDYIGYMLQEEEETRRLAALEAARRSVEETTASTAPAKALVPQTDEIIGRFIEENGERRIRLRESSDEELQRPNLPGENTQGQGAFTEALARIYIKQGKFEQAIEIIRRLSLKYPKKNTYFADQIRFLEKLLLNQRLSKAKKEAKKDD